MKTLTGIFTPPPGISRQDIKVFYRIAIGFLLLNIIFIMNDFYWLSLLPAAMLLVIFIILSTDMVLLFVVFTTPLAINVKDVGLGVGMSIPSEPIVFGLMVIFFLKLLREGKFDRNILLHPVSIAIIINMLWMGFTVISSTMPVVSIKYFISRLWFVAVFYFLGTQLFKRSINIKRFVWLYAIPLAGVIIYTTINHARFGFNQVAAHWVMLPFYNDHTAYAAVIAMFIPIFISFTADKNQSRQFRFFAGLFSLFFLIAIVLSYTRAAWVSLASALFVYIIFLFRIRVTTLVMIAGILAGGFLLFRSEIEMKIEKNRQDSSSEYSAHIQSISNVTTDASNLERINRWKSAFRMFEQKPVLGWGPGTYQFKYAPFQHSKEKTIISTNAGDRGNAHSEYIGPLAESGVLGMLTFLAVVITILYRGVRLYSRESRKDIKAIVLGILLGLITYLVHGVMNNFLDTDKASVPFWGFIGMLVAMDVYQSRKETPSDPA